MRLKDVWSRFSPYSVRIKQSQLHRLIRSNYEMLSAVAFANLSNRIEMRVQIFLITSTRGVRIDVKIIAGF